MRTVSRGSRIGAAIAQACHQLVFRNAQERAGMNDSVPPCQAPHPGKAGRPGTRGKPHENGLRLIVPGVRGHEMTGADFPGVLLKKRIAGLARRLVRHAPAGAGGTA